MKRRRLALGIALFATIIAVAAGHSLYAIRGRAFDADAWSLREQASDHIAERMADRLVAERALQGMTRDEIIRKLGLPTVTRKFKDWGLVYWLGPERGFLSIDSEWLVVRLGDDQHVAEYRIVRD